MSEGYEIKKLYNARFKFDEEDIHKFVRYRKEEVNRDVQFKIGMNFCSLLEFKEAIVEHSIMNGRQAVF